MYILDTDVLSNLVRKTTSPVLRQKLGEVSPELIFTSAITLSEIFYGVFRSPHRERILAELEDKVFPFVSVLSFDEDCARYFGEIKARLDKRGWSRSDLDLCVAAIAVRHRCVLVTGNVRHFQGIPGLKVENWLSD